MNTPSIFNPDQEVVLSNGDKIKVQLLKWKAALEFFAKLEQTIKGLLDEKGNLALDSQKLMAAISSNLELLEWLVLNATRKDAAFLETLDLGDMMKLARTALEVNLGSIALEIKNVKSRLTNLAAGETSPKLSPTSPASATP